MVRYCWPTKYFDYLVVFQKNLKSISTLYTAIRRCCDRLVICESNKENNILWQKFKRFIADETKLGTAQNFAESKEDGAKINAMMSDDCINLAIDFIEVAEECDDPEQKKKYNNARNCAQAQRADIPKRLDQRLGHVDLWDTLRRSNGSISFNGSRNAGIYGGVGRKKRRGACLGET